MVFLISITFRKIYLFFSRLAEKQAIETYFVKGPNFRVQASFHNPSLCSCVAVSSNAICTRAIN